MKTINALASKIAKLEGKKSQARIGDIKEILGILSDIIYAEHEQLDHYLDCIDEGRVLYLLCNNGAKRAKKSSSKARKKSRKK